MLGGRSRWIGSGLKCGGDGVRGQAGPEPTVDSGGGGGCGGDGVGKIPPLTGWQAGAKMLIFRSNVARGVRPSSGTPIGWRSTIQHKIFHL